MSNNVEDTLLSHNLEDKISLVTGASRGIGHAILHALAKQGARVIGTATTQEGAEKITAGLKDAKLKGVGKILNVADADEITQFLDKIKMSEGSMPQILVNNAGITRDSLLMRMTDEQWQEVLNVNLTSIFRLSKGCVRSMIKARWGRIINIGSVVGAIGNPGQSNYCAAKAGLAGFSKSLAKEVAVRGITVNVVAPGFIETDMTKNLPEEWKLALEKSIPVQYQGQPEDIAAAVVYLASDSARYVTGQTLHVNGGLHMN